MSLLWACVSHTGNDLSPEAHANHALHPAFLAAGILPAPCGYSLCSEADDDHTEAFDEAENRMFKGDHRQESLDLSKPLHGFEAHADSEYIHKLAKGETPYGEKPAPSVYRFKGEHYIMNGHHRLAGALLSGQRRHPVRMVDLDRD